nr:cation transporter [Granulosicoccus sp.]
MASATALPVDSTVDDCYTAYDHPELASRYVRKKDTEAATGGSTSQVVIQLENLQCAGCCSTVEKALAKLPGVIGAEVNYTTHQLRVGWNLQQTELSTILRLLGKLGYPGQPLGVDTRGDLLARQRSSLLKRFGVAAAFGMQIMVLSVCLYTGQWWGIEPELADLFRYLSLLLVIPILVYSARPFFVAAVRSLFSGRIGMDVPVSLGLTVAFLASLYSLGTGGLEIYFDSIAMFVFLVLGSRLIESGHRLRAVNAVAVYDAVLPVSALKKFKQDQWRHIPAMSLEPGDQVAVDSGEVVPADGVILTGRSSFDE